MANLHDQGFMLEDWRVFPAEGTLVNHDHTVHLEPKVMDVLVYLAAHPGSVITREQLERDVWHGAIISYDSVTATVIKLRKALHDDSKKPHIIATIPKKGYQLITDVHDLADTPVAHDTPPPASAEARAIPVAPQRRPVPRAWLFGAAILMLAAVSTGLWQWYAPGAAHHIPSLLVLPIENLNHNATNDVFVDGITEDIINDISRISGVEIQCGLIFHVGQQLQSPHVFVSCQAFDLGKQHFTNSLSAIGFRDNQIFNNTDRSTFSGRY